MHCTPTMHFECVNPTKYTILFINNTDLYHGFPLLEPFVLVIHVSLRFQSENDG